MSCDAYIVHGELSSPKFGAAFAKGCGGLVKDKYEGGSWAGFPSPSNWNDVIACISGGNDYFYGDKGYFDRERYFRVTKNAFFHDGIGISDGKRFKKFGITPKERRGTGVEIVLCPQTDHFFSRHGMTQDHWIACAIEAIEKHTNRPIVIHHKRDSKPLSKLIKSAWAVVSFSSNACLEAVLEGVPAFCTGNSHIKRLVSRDFSTIENPFFPPIEIVQNHCEVLADNQWNLEEIAAGECWRKLNGEI